MIDFLVEIYYGFMSMNIWYRAIVLFWVLCLVVPRSNRIFND